MGMHPDEGVNWLCKNNTDYSEGEIDEIVEECIIENFVVFGLYFMKQSA